MIINILIIIGVLSTIAFIIVLYKVDKLRLNEPEEMDVPLSHKSLLQIGNTNNLPSNEINYPTISSEVLFRESYSKLLYLSIAENNLVLFLSGNSTSKADVLVSLLYYMNETEKITLPDPIERERFSKLFDEVKHNNFTSYNLVNDFDFINLYLEPRRKSSKPVNLLLANMKNDLKYVAPAKYFQYEKPNYAEWNNLSTHLLLITDYDSMYRDDILFNSCLNYFDQWHSKQHNNIVLIINKWNERSKGGETNSESIEQTINHRMPATSNFLKTISHSNYSVIIYSLASFGIESQSNKNFHDLYNSSAKKLIGKIYEDITNTNFG